MSPNEHPFYGRFENMEQQIEEQAAMPRVTVGQLEKYKAPDLGLTPAIYMTQDELIRQASRAHSLDPNVKKATLVFDIEVYPNYFLAAFMDYETGNVITLETKLDENGIPTEFPAELAKYLCSHFRLVGFNSWAFDEPMLWAAISGMWPSRLKELSDSLINRERFSPSAAEKEFGFTIGFMDSIDLQAPCPEPSTFISLKHLAARMEIDRIQDLPYHPDTELDDFQMTGVKHYCFDDLITTAYMLGCLEGEIELREIMGEEYGADLRSRSDAQIAERVIVGSIENMTGVRVHRPKMDRDRIIYYQIPDFVEFHTPQFKEMLEVVRNSAFTLDKGGKPKMPPELSGYKLTLGKSVYKMGIGGLHSQEKRRSFSATNGYVLIDRDVESYYPRIILNQRLFPLHIGEEFLITYEDIVNRRLTAKAEIKEYKTSDPERAAMAKRISDALKICINGTFGKLGNQYSKIYSPELLLQVTLTGQLALLMLIEMMEMCDIPVVSANTDGIVMHCPQEKEAHLNWIVQCWEEITDFKTEETRYSHLYSRDVNNYIAIGEKGDIKAKGVYACGLTRKNVGREKLMSNRKFEICSEAVMKFLTEDVPLEKTIRGCKDVRKFTAIQKVTGGAAKDDVYLGKVIRWYMRKGEFGRIQRVSNGNQIPDTVGGYPLMQIDGMPRDIDHEYYVRYAAGILKDIGYYATEVQGSLF